MYKTLKKTFTKDNDLPDRTFRVQCLQRVLKGTIYDQLKHAFHDEKSGDGKYIPLRERRPCVRSNLCRIVVDDSVSLLFSEGHFPAIEMQDKETSAKLNKLLKEMRLNESMIDCATRGSVGSAAILFQVLESRVFLKVMDTDYLTPTWKPKAPDTLQRVTEKYKVDGAALKASGYEIADDDLKAQHWFMREWGEAQETWYVPWKVADKDKVPVVDDERTVIHELGFVPVIWIKNLPGGDDIDGLPTFPDEAIDTQIEVDYQLSQAGRGLKYSSDPTLLIKEPANGSDGAPMIKGAADAIIVSQDGDAKLLEINGSATAAVLDYVKHLRELALEAMHGNRASAEKLSAAQSGRAMELLAQALVWLADRLRISYGEYALNELVSMIVRASKKMTLRLKNGDEIGQFDAKADVTLRWPDWFPPTADDRMNTAITLAKLCDSGLMSRETAIKALSSQYDIEDPAAEKLLADADIEKRNADAQKKVQITE